jgi:hypothetical protein
MRLKFVLVVVALFLVNFCGVVFTVGGEIVPTQKEQRFVETVLLPSFDKIENSYAVEELRNDFGDILKLVRQKKIAISITNEQRKKYSLAVAGEDEMWIFIPFAIEMYDQYGQDVFLDMIVLAVLHEYYHVKNHKQQFKELETLKNKAKKKENIFLVESDAWQYTFTKIIDPMIKSGRFQKMPDGLRRGYSAWKESQGNELSLVWVNYINSLVE